MSENVIPLPPRKEGKPPDGSLEETVANLTAALENLDAGMKMAIDALVQLDKRIRALEIAQRKVDRKKPVIVNQHGERAN